MTIEDVSQACGCSRSMIRDLISDGILPAYLAEEDRTRWQINKGDVVKLLSRLSNL
ncbi:MAG: helix-turn-helix domain-containing protein [Spirochaetaceae bacterium]|nr:helix-turn-helix domain-containing protein [Spirochaetaceae bacterium]